jgi:putative flippase GtrA
MYLIFGGVTTLVSWIVYSVCVLLLRDESILYHLTLTAVKQTERVLLNWEFEPYIAYSTAISWVISVSVAFVTNKLWVFGSRNWKGEALRREAATFFGGRILTGVFEIIAVPLLVAIGLNQSAFGIEGLPAKIIVSVAVIILNYILSKFISFRVEKS